MTDLTHVAALVTIANSEYKPATRRAARNLAISLLRDMMAIPQEIHDNILTTGEIYEGQQVGRINAIKMYKNRVGCDLLTAKNTVDKYFADHNLYFFQS